MTLRPALVVVLLLLSCALTPARRQEAAEPTPPIAPRKPHVRELHGERFEDDWFWLREKGTKDVEDYLRAEEAWAQQQLFAPRKPFTDRLFAEIVSHIAEDDTSPPVKDGAWEYWRAVVAGKEHPVYLRRKLPDGPAETILDLNALAAGKAFLELGLLTISDDGRYALFATDETGFRDYTLRVKDLTSGQVLADELLHVETAAWASGTTFFYVVEDAAKRPWQLYRHTLGERTDTLVFEERDERFRLEVDRSSSRRFVLVESRSQLASEVRLIDSRRPGAAPVLIAPRRDAHEYSVDDDGERLIIRTNDLGRNFRVVTAPLDAPAKWKELVAHDEAVKLEGLQPFKGFLALEVRRRGLLELDVLELATGRRETIPLPEPVHTAWLDDNRELDAPTLRFRYTSLTTPGSWFSWDLAKKTSTLIKQTPVPGFDPSRYATARLEATARDGTKIPISLVFRKDLARPAPLWLEAYGAYGDSSDPSFSPASIPLLERGVVLATAHVRGGGELGKAWHEQGRLAHKQNTFTDFIACAEHLVAERWTTPQRLVIQGGSAGGLLMGAVTNLRPELFKAVIADVPFVDVINTMSDPSLPLTVTEFEEWGNPAKPEEYAWLRAYSPYDNLAAKAYPAMLVRSSYNDSQVMYFEPAKYVARLRSLKTDRNPLLFHVDLSPAGHGGKSGRYEQYREAAEAWTFGLWQLGLAPEP